MIIVDLDWFKVHNKSGIDHTYLGQYMSKLAQPQSISNQDVILYVIDVLAIDLRSL